VSDKPSIVRRIANSWRAYRRRGFGTIDMVADGFICSERGRETAIHWNDVTRIEAGLRDLLTIDIFFVVIRAGAHELMIEEFADGFRQLENAIFERWPDVRAQYHALQNGEPHRPRRQTLWQR